MQKGQVGMYRAKTGKEPFKYLEEMPKKYLLSTKSAKLFMCSQMISAIKFTSQYGQKLLICYILKTEALMQGEGGHMGHVFPQPSLKRVNPA